MPSFQIHASFSAAGDQPQAIENLIDGIHQHKKEQVLLGITGSGKTFSMANIIAQTGRPALIIAHNKTLAAQLYNEFCDFFPENAVEYFVSFYDYYQPEAYVPQRDLYIEKDTAINDNLERMRLSATRSLFEREDVIIIASVSCIYGLGSPEEYGEMALYVKIGDKLARAKLLQQLIAIRYERNDYDFFRGSFRVRGDCVEVYMAEKDYGIRIELFGDEVDAIVKFSPLNGKKLESLSKVAFFPNSHYVASEDQMPETLRLIREELEIRLQELHQQNKLVEFQRLKQRVEYDLEMLEETGSCKGIENYSRILQRRQAGEPSPTLISYLPPHALLFIDESHVTLPQVRGMYLGDHSRKLTLVEHGFRLPSALDNRPYRFEEFENLPQTRVYVSATPSQYELEKSQNTVEQIIRPTGLLDPQIEVRPVLGQVEDMLAEIQERVKNSERILITALTKRMVEDLAEYYDDLDIKVRYLHSEIDAIERTVIIQELRQGEFDVLIGVNLLREGLDIPEVSLIGIFDADKEGFLRSTTSLIQTIGRAARNTNGKVIMYADTITGSMQRAMDITEQRRAKQQTFNQKHGIIPKTIYKRIHESLVQDPVEQQESLAEAFNQQDQEMLMAQLEKEMLEAADHLEFEKAAKLRDRMQMLQKALSLKQ